MAITKVLPAKLYVRPDIVGELPPKLAGPLTRDTVLACHPSGGRMFAGQKFRGDGKQHNIGAQGPIFDSATSPSDPLADPVGERAKIELRRSAKSK